MSTIPLLFEFIPTRFCIIQPNAIFQKDTKTISNTPPEPFPLQIMPQPNVHKDNPRTKPLVLTATQGDVQIADRPLVETRMPELPEEAWAQNHRYAVRHVFVRINTVKHAKQAEETPND